MPSPDDRRTPDEERTPPSAAPRGFLDPAGVTSFAAPILDDIAAREAAEEVTVARLLARGLAPRYTLDRLIGRGGMAFVYSAADSRLARRVAVKVMRPSATHGLGAERFVREVGTTAALQHPYIVPIYDVGEVDGLLYYLMALVDGESLRARLSREHQLPVDDAVRLACEIADALDHAHAHNVLHRDVKPENVLLEGGHARVADFGIARAINRKPGDRLTGTGVSIGTPRYMSPEQLSGDAVDARSDVYSLGCLLYEMLAGDPPHVASTPEALESRVLHARVESLCTLRPSVPQRVDAAVQRALARLPADRFATAGDFAAALRAASPVPTSGIGRVVAPPAILQAPSRWPAGVTIAGALAALSVFALTALRWVEGNRLPDDGQPPMTFHIAVPDTGSQAIGARPPQGELSPDGAHMAIVTSVGASPAILLREMSSGALTRVPGSADAQWVRFSPDGKHILFVARDRLWRSAVAGGAPRPITHWVGNATWVNADEIIVERLWQLYRVSADGGRPEPIPVRIAGRGQVFAGRAHALPDGKSLLLSVVSTTLGARDPTAELAVLELASGSVTLLGLRGHNPKYVEPGLIVYGRDESLFAAPFSLRGRAVTGDEMLLDANLDAQEISVSRAGTLVYVPSRSRGERRVVAVDRAGRARPLATTTARFMSLRVSPDGRRVALHVQRAGIWILDVASGTLSRLTNLESARRPEWMPDGRRVAYAAVPESLDTRVILTQPWDGVEAPRVLIRHARPLWEVSIAGSGTLIAVQADQTDGSGEDVFIAPADDLASLRPVAATRALEFGPRLSHDGKLLAYVQQQDENPQVFVRSTTGDDRRIQASIDAGTHPIWSRDGRTLYYRAASHLVAAQLRAGPDLAVLRRDTVFRDRFLQPDRARAAYDVLGDGFVMLEATDSIRTDSLHVVLNWSADVRRRLRQRDR